MGFAVDGSRTMEQDDKVSAAALSPSLATGHGRASRVLDRSGAAVESESGDRVRGSHAASDNPSSQPLASNARAARSVEDDVREEEEPPGGKKPGNSLPPSKKSNNVRRIRIERMMSKAELARRANLSVLTIDRVERGFGCRMDTKRKILEALGLSLADRVRVFGEEE